MKSKINLEKVFIALVFILGLTLAIFYLMKNTNDSKTFKDEKNSATSQVEKQQKASAKIKEIKEANSSLLLEYETTKIPEITSLVYKEDSGYKSIIIDTNTAEEVSFDSLIKSEAKESFDAKEKNY